MESDERKWQSSRIFDSIDLLVDVIAKPSRIPFIFHFINGEFPVVHSVHVVIRQWPIVNKLAKTWFAIMPKQVWLILFRSLLLEWNHPIRLWKNHWWFENCFEIWCRWLWQRCWTRCSCLCIDISHNYSLTLLFINKYVEMISWIKQTKKTTTTRMLVSLAFLGPIG